MMIDYGAYQTFFRSDSTPSHDDTHASSSIPTAMQPEAVIDVDGGDV